MRIALPGPAAFLGLVLMAGPAAAQYYYPPPVIGDAADPYYGQQGDRICRRMCREDRSPCDPVHWKTADGRCSGRRRWDD